MRVLFVDENLAFPLNSGKKLRTYHLLKETSQKHEITCITYVDAYEDQNSKKHYESLGIRVVPIKPPNINKTGLSMLKSVGKNIFQSSPFSSVAYDTPQIRAAIKNELNIHNYDLFHCELTQLAQFISLADSLPSVLNAHNIEAIIWQRLANITSNPLKKLGYIIQAKKMGHFEKYYSNQYSLVIYVSENDRKIAQKRYNINNTEVVENGVDIKHFNFYETKVTTKEILFVGAMDWRPTQDGVVYFLDEILPCIWKLDPDITFTAVGKSPPDWLKSKFKHNDSIRICPDVDDIREYYSNSRAVVVPLRVGSGSRLKILEAFAMGCPVVSTSVGAEGLDVYADHHLIIKDTPEEFAEAIINLINNPDRVRNLVRHSRDYVVENHNWKQLGKKLNNLWHSVYRNP